MAAPSLPAARHLPAALILLACSCVALCCFPVFARAALGQWTALQPLGGEAVHMALLPDPEIGYPNRHSRLVWWQNKTIGNVLRWPRPAGEDCTNFPVLDTIGAWNPGADIFCSGHVPMDGKLMTFGGNASIHLWGITDARRYDPVTGFWTEQPSMAQARWYPTATVLRDSRALVAAGNKGEQLWLSWGRRDGAWPTGTTGDQVHRFGRAMELTPSENGYWDPSVVPLADAGLRPAVREGHTMERLFDPFQTNPDVRAQFFFGGRNAAGDPVASEVWVLRRETGGTLDLDYTYQWRRLTVQGVLPPEPRSEHTAVRRSSTELFIFGGLKKVGGVETPTDELWRLYRDPNFPNPWRWEPITATGTLPSARWGHAAVYQTGPGYGERMLVFGGAETAPGAGGALAESRVWAYDFDRKDWSEVPTRDDDYRDRPRPRRDHVMICDSLGGGVVLYGGYLGPTFSSDTLWLLVTENPPALEPASWFALETQGTSPGPRWGHSATWENQSGSLVFPPAQRRLFIFGGLTGNPPVPADKKVYMIEPFAAPRKWYPSREAPFSLSGHTADVDPYGLMHARTPEIYDPASNTWTQNPATSWLQSYYPLHFVVPGNPTGGGRVVAVGGDPQARYLDIPASGPAGSWQNVGTAGSGNSGFNATSGVMYEPGRILIAGGLGGGTVVGTSRTLDARNVTNGWVATSVPMAARLEHNLVLLPTGEVLAVGGVTTTGIGSTAAQNCPQLWSPISRSWTDLTCDLDGIASSRCPVPPCPVVRNYHSTSLLLPDARVISAGGFSPNPYRFDARLFCPPYLFKPGVTLAQFAPRPVITSAPSTLAWGQVFTICTPNPAAVQKVCLIRPASTTHSFDQNQRYVPLTIQGTATDPPRLFVTAPPGRDDAPPGDYLLFLVGSADGSSTYPEAPSVAEWVRLQATGDDLCDVIPGDVLADLTPEIVGSTSIGFTWTATADDGSLPASGPAREFDLRYTSIGPITNETMWGLATWATGEPVPDPNGSPHEHTLSNLQPCTNYYFALRSKDDKPNLSGIPGSLSVQTTCGGGGGEFSAREARSDEGGSGTEGNPLTSVVPGTTAATSSARSATGRSAAATSSAGSLAPTTGLLVVDTRREGEQGWRVTLTLRETPAGSDPSTATITVEQGGAGGERDTLGRFEPSAADHVLGLCSLRERGRLGIPGVHRIERVVPHLKTRTGDHVLTAAAHSRLGALGGEFIASGGGVEFAVGDSLVLIYIPAAAPLADAASWYVLVRRTGEAPPIPMGSRRGRVGEALPVQFALHQNRPNPFRGTTSIAFDLPAESPVSLEVFDLLGRRVAVLADAGYPAGRHSVEWDLRDLSGTRVRPGVYAYRLSAGAFRERRKMNVLE